MSSFVLTVVHSGSRPVNAKEKHKRSPKPSTGLVVTPYNAQLIGQGLSWLEGSLT
jgi:hypothetical protein